MTTAPQATFVVEYPCDQFCRVEVELTGERNHITLQQMWEKADGTHRQIHEPESSGATAPDTDQEAISFPAATVFRSAPARDDDRRREERSRPRR